MTHEVDVTPNFCAECGAPFVCGAIAGQSSCWCMEKPTGLLDLDPDAGAGCYCPACLDKRISERRGDGRSSAAT